ncbi:MAG: hypothetical protein IIA91_10005 [Chloroflexi bacterium]|nr:hypothetical protein [Chloroflexota bacterium]
MMGKFTVLILSVFVFFAFVLGVNAQPSSEEPFPAEVESCLRAAFGDARFEAFASGAAELTPEEMSQVEQCFNSYYGPPPPDTEYPPVEYFPPEAESCLRAAWGDARFEALNSGQAEPTAEEMSQVEQCFDSYYDPPPPDSEYPPDDQPPEPIGMPPELTDCLIDSFGEERFQAISSGQSEPTPEEMALSQHCFETYSGPVPLPPSDAPLPEPIGMSPELIECLESVFGEERFQAITTGQSEPTPEEMRLGGQCFQGYGGPDFDGTQPPGASPDVGLEPWLEACLLEAIGSERFNAISSGQSQPTAAEEQLGGSCFAQLGHERATVVSSPDRAIGTEVLQCLKLALGEARFIAISEGSASPTLAERDKAEKCFGSTPAPFSPPPQLVLDESLIDCLINAVGEERYQAISLGESQPTSEEREEGAACFRVSESEGGLSLDAILPLPSEQVPYLPENPDAISVDDISQEEDDDSADYTETVTIEGLAPPGEVVDIYVHSSTAVVASTEADPFGKWSYTVLGLEQGPHLVYATAKVDGETERSVGTTFQAGAGGGTNWILWGLLLGVVPMAILVMGFLRGFRLVGATGRSTPPA